jgi:nucleoside 2-deoxyribosyltransferase
MRVVYIAGPFRGPNYWEQEQNIRRAETLAHDVWLLGAAALCPHANTRFYQGSAPDRVWLDGDIALMARCDAVLMTPDWERSTGARAEHEYARTHGIPVFYDLDSLRRWLADCAADDAGAAAV